jgi:HD-like signal output (HDOD) protein
VIAFLKSLLARLTGRKPAAAASATSPSSETAEARVEPRGPAPRGIADSVESDPTSGRRRAALLDGRACAAAKLIAAEEILLEEIDRRIETGEFHLPQLPSKSATIISLANDPRSEMKELTKLISTDPVLSGELVRTANSAMYAGHEPVRSIQAGVMRIGTRALRTIVLSVSMRGIRLTSKSLASYGEYVWGQTQSVSRIAWSIGPQAGFEQETAFLLAMLHDVGKLPLLSMLDDVSRGGRTVSRALIGKVFQRFHERVGRALADRWQMGDELVSVAGCHHDFEKNEEYPKSAALVSLAHKLDLYQSLSDDRGFEALLRCKEMDILGIEYDSRHEILATARHAYSTPDIAEASREQAA